MNVILNEHEYELLSASPRANELELVIVNYPDLDDLAADCEAHAGDIVVTDGDVSRTYIGYEKLTRLQVDLVNHTAAIVYQQVYNDTEALIALVGERPTVAEAKEKRSEIETLAAFADDETADRHAWAFPLWSGDTMPYAAGDRVRYGELLYKCLQGHISQEDWTPDTAVSLWVRVSDPAEEWPEWIQPAGAQDAYALGDKVSHNEKRWISVADANVWEPGVYGWDEVTG